METWTWGGVISCLMLVFIVSVVFMMPAIKRQQRALFEDYRKQLDKHLVELIGPYSRAPERIAERSVMLHCDERVEYSDNRISGMRWEVFSADANANYWFHIVYSISGKPAIKRPMTEMRVRKVLFAKPLIYEKAFGEKPEKKQLAAEAVHSYFEPKNS